MENNQNLKIKNPLIRAGVYSLLAMIIAIGASWIFLGVISPVLLILLIQKW